MKNGILTFLCLFSALNVFSQELPSRVKQVGFPFARVNALGGNHVGLNTDFSSLFSNPALFASAEPKKNFAEISLDVIYVDLIYRMIFTDDPLSEMRDAFTDRFTAFIDLGGPIAFGWMGRNYGWGLFNVSRFETIWDRQAIYMLTPTLSEEFTFAGAYGFSPYMGNTARLDLGVTTKIFVRLGWISQATYLQEIKYLMNNLTEIPFEIQFGCGFDVGLRWTLFESLSFGFVLYDPFAPVLVTKYSRASKVADQQMIDQGTVPVTPRASVGISWRMASPFWHYYFSDITLSVDYVGVLENMAENPRDPLLNISAGIEVRMLEVFSIRGGFLGMQPSCGIGIDFTFMNIDLAFYMKELGILPSSYPTAAITIDISFHK
ncbi:MAG: hypothetical protein LBD44_06620 [Spirochaetaceae bacterium]|jgi:hypothetical protein|nr:hypothetical protein [Spirochaetaceae bacterium]